MPGIGRHRHQQWPPTHVPFCLTMQMILLGLVSAGSRFTSTTSCLLDRADVCRTLKLQIVAARRRLHSPTLPMTVSHGENSSAQAARGGARVSEAVKLRGQR